MEIKEFEFGLGETLRDKVTGFQGVVMVRAEYSTGCVHYGLCPRELKDGKPIDWEWIDSSRLERVSEFQPVDFGQPQRKTASGPFPAGPQM